MKNYLVISAILASGLSAPAVAAPVQWTVANGGNDHWYELVSPAKGKINWTTAANLARSSDHLGQTGYLASVTSAGEQKFLNRLNASFTATRPTHKRKFTRAWLGGTDAATEGTWEWTTGEAFSYTNWMTAAQSKRAKRKGNKKDYLAGWARGKKWKDCRDNKRSCNVFKYVVEYDMAPVATPPISAVPVPASLPMILGGLGLMAFFGRRRKKS